MPAVKALPPTSYLEHEAEGERAKAAISSVESEIETKKQEIAYLKQLPNLDPIIPRLREGKPRTRTSQGEGTEAEAHRRRQRRVSGGTG